MERLAENISDAAKLKEVVSNLHTCMRLFSQCTLHKLPHLLASEVLYTADCAEPSLWYNWTGPLAKGIHKMTGDFLADMAGRTSILAQSHLIANISYAGGGISMMDPAARAIAVFVLTMAQAIRYAECGVTWGQSDHMHYLPPSICNLFRTSTNPYSFILQRFFKHFGAMAPIGVHSKCKCIFDFYFRHGSLHSARDRFKQTASHLRQLTLERTCSPRLRSLLGKILIPSSS